MRREGPLTGGCVGGKYVPVFARELRRGEEAPMPKV